MKRNWKKISAACALGLLLMGAAVPAFAKDDDPLVSLSYLNQRLEAIQNNQNQKSAAPSGAQILEVV
ncbi:MAG: hypothetical protein ACLUOC_04855 [Peptoniphilaceae bacterium]